MSLREGCRARLLVGGIILAVGLVLPAGPAAGSGGSCGGGFPSADVDAYVDGLRDLLAVEGVSAISGDHARGVVRVGVTDIGQLSTVVHDHARSEGIPVDAICVEEMGPVAPAGSSPSRTWLLLPICGAFVIAAGAILRRRRVAVAPAERA